MSFLDCIWYSNELNVWCFDICIRCCINKLPPPTSYFSLEIFPVKLGWTFQSSSAAENYKLNQHDSNVSANNDDVKTQSSKIYVQMKIDWHDQWLIYQTLFYS